MYTHTHTHTHTVAYKSVTKDTQVKMNQQDAALKQSLFENTNSLLS